MSFLWLQLSSEVAPPTPQQSQLSSENKTFLPSCFGTPTGSDCKGSGAVYTAQLGNKRLLVLHPPGYATSHYTTWLCASLNLPLCEPVKLLNQPARHGVCHFICCIPVCASENKHTISFVLFFILESTIAPSVLGCSCSRTCSHLSSAVKCFCGLLAQLEGLLYTAAQNGTAEVSCREAALFCDLIMPTEVTLTAIVLDSVAPHC